MHRLSSGLIVFLLASFLAAAEPSRIEWNIRDAATKEKTPCRIHLLDANGKPVKPEDLALPYWKDHFVCDGSASFSLPPGNYRYEIERGPEYASIQKPLTASPGSVVRIEETLTRITNLADEGWWSGETHVHRPLGEIPLLMQSEDLHVAVVMTWWNDRNAWKQEPLPSPSIVLFDQNRMYDMLGGEDERGGGAILMFGLDVPLPIAGSQRESPPSVKWLHEAKEKNAWVDAEKPFWWDYPLWLSTNKLDSVGIANNHMTRGGMYPGREAWGKPRDLEKFPEPLGNALWTQEIYYHTLNAGFRIPPSAGSASGVLPNPVGYNRMYVNLPDQQELTWENWWSAVRAGRLFVTNGPLLRVTANNKISGHVFQSPEPLELTIEGRLDSRDPIAAIELVHNGRVELLPQLPAKITLHESGWFLIRARCDTPHTFRFASTAPWYLEIANKPNPTHKDSCDFFRHWTEERIDHLRQNLPTEELRKEVLPIFENATHFWKQRAVTCR